MLAAAAASRAAALTMCWVAWAASPPSEARAAAAPVELVVDGEAAATIVLPRVPSWIELEAAHELVGAGPRR